MITCKGDDDHGAPAFQRFRAGATFGFFASELTFGGGPHDVHVERRAVTAGFDWRFGPESTLSFGAGASIGGHAVMALTRYTFLPGWLVTAAYSRQLVDGKGKKPFVLLAVSGGASGASLREQVRNGVSQPEAKGFYAIDVRAGLTVGKTFWNVFSPYAAVRAFGGPVFWKYRDTVVTGTDQYHFQLAAGAVTALPRGFDLFAEVAPLGERAVTIGGGMSF